MIDNSEILLILNPNSGKKKISKIIKLINKIDRNLNYIVTENIQDVKNIFEKYIVKYKVFVIVGGDGTVNEAIKYLINHPDKYLSVFPNGSGNGFAKELGFKQNLKSLINDINHGDTMDLDIIKINDLLCINTCGVGIDSYVAHAFSKTKNRGFFNYILLTAKSLFTFGPFKAKIILDDFRIDGEYLMLTIANTRQFGNNAFIAPMAKPNDGVIELILVKPFPFYMYPVFILKMFQGKLKKSRYIECLRIAKDFIIDSDYKDFHIDGEPIQVNGELNISILRNRIRIIKTAHNTL